jgi:hypothetical protein
VFLPNSAAILTLLGNSEEIERLKCPLLHVLNESALGSGLERRKLGSKGGKPFMGNKLMDSFIGNKL